ncbi:MAG: type VI secretion system-associated protein TagF [Beijerinckiaceae bacterium]
MPCGLYGKLPMKRDFISVEAPRNFLSVWEPWLQGGIAGSRIRLGTGWRDVFLRAPIWRFWLGPDICGYPVIGSFMSSVDGVGRFFPLTAIAHGDKGDMFARPPDDPHTEWFSEVEALLLSVLEEGATYDACLQALAALPVPPRSPAPAPNDSVRYLYRASAAPAPSPDDIPAGISTLLSEREGRMYSGASFWWTIGGEEFAPMVLAADGLPDPNIVTAMLNGQFEEAAG